MKEQDESQQEVREQSRNEDDPNQPRHRGAVTLQGSRPTEKIKDDVSAPVQQMAGVT